MEKKETQSPFERRTRRMAALCRRGEQGQKRLLEAARQLTECMNFSVSGISAPPK